MKGETRERWERLCELAADERDQRFTGSQRATAGDAAEASFRRKQFGF